MKMKTAICSACILFLLACTTVYSQWTDLGFRATYTLAMTSNGHGLELANIYGGGGPGQGTPWDARLTTDDWATMQTVFQYPGSYYCCPIQDVDMVTDSVGFAAMRTMFSNDIIRTTDAGSHWLSMRNGIGQPSFDHIRALNDSTVYVVDANYLGITAYRLTPIHLDTVFSSSNYEYDFAEIQFVSNSAGFILVHDSNLVYSVLQTTDGGINWVQQLATGVGTLKCIDFVNDSTGFVAGDSGAFYQTIDGGFTWTSMALAGQEDVKAMDFIDDQIGYLACNAGLVKYTTDGGNTWTDENISSNFEGNYVKTLSASMAYVGTINYHLFKKGALVPVHSDLPYAQEAPDIYPNPTRDQVQIMVPAGQALREWTLTDLYGKRVQEGNSSRLDLSQLPNGAYFLEIGTNDQVYRARVLKVD